MTIVENSARRLVLNAGSTTLTLDKDAGTAALQRKVLLWNRKPTERPLAEVSGVAVDGAVDRASGVEVCHTMLIFREGSGWAFPAADRREAQANAAIIQQFLGLTG